jgi:hypothetical protein
MSAIDVRADEKKNALSAYERKIARARPVFLQAEILDEVVRDQSAYLTDLGKKLSNK